MVGSMTRRVAFEGTLPSSRMTRWVTFSAVVNVASTGTFENGYIAFDYVDADNFKFAGLAVDSDEIDIGQVSGGAWTVNASTGLTTETDVDYLLRLWVKDEEVDIFVDDVKRLSHNYGESIDDGTVGLMVHQSNARFDNFQVKQLEIDPLPPSATVRTLFSTSTGGSLTGITVISKAVSLILPSTPSETVKEKPSAMVSDPSCS